MRIYTPEFILWAQRLPVFNGFHTPPQFQVIVSVKQIGLGSMYYERTCIYEYIRHFRPFS